ncbi:MAG: hypothetical protein IJT65_02210 [Eubacterium sp.]|nr:hypothetical protein [Eubacterium sp.]
MRLSFAISLFIFPSKLSEKSKVKFSFIRYFSSSILSASINAFINSSRLLIFVHPQHFKKLFFTFVYS